MAKLTSERLQEILAAHKLWIESLGESGARADLAAQDLREFAETIRGANMSGADMSGANMSGANMSGADMSGADMSGADMRGANMSGADMLCANMSDANMSGANMSGANMSGADMSGADMRGANMSGADMRGANMSGADMSGADMSGARLNDGLREQLAVPDLDKNILAAIEAPGGKLNMQAWHTCETTHCRAGWAVVIAGEKGALLESLYGTCAAASLIYACSRPDKPIPDFFATNEAAMESIKADAAA